MSLFDVRQEAEFPDCIMLSYSFRISLLKHAILVTDSCEAFRTMWKNPPQKPDLVNLLGKGRQGEAKVELLQDRDLRQAKLVDTLEPKW